MALSDAFKFSTVACAAVLAGCGGFGRVNQGQVIRYQRSEGLVTLIQDSNYRDPAHPRFDMLPPISIRVPEDPAEMGPEPEAGKLLQLDRSNRRAAVFDAASQTIRTVPYTLVSEREARPDELAGGAFPVVDRTTGTITVHSPADRKVIAFTVAPEYLSLPDDTWKPGDEIRYYYKDPARALRLMNVSKTDLGKVVK